MRATRIARIPSKKRATAPARLTCHANLDNLRLLMQAIKHLRGATTMAPQIRLYNPVIRAENAPDITGGVIKILVDSTEEEFFVHKHP